MPVPILKGKLLRRAVPTTIRAVDEKSRSITFVASDETVDRYGDMIRVSGWKLENFRKNPVFLWSHMHDTLPIGRVTDVRMELEPVPVLLAKVQFTDEFEFADICFRLYKTGFLNAVSVGLMIDAWNPRPADPANPDEMPGWESTSQELYELSAVPVPANPNALARELAGGVVDGRLDGSKVFQAMCLKAIKEGIVTEQDVGVLGQKAHGMAVLLSDTEGTGFKDVDVACAMPQLPAPVAVKELADPGPDVAPAFVAPVVTPVADPVAAPVVEPTPVVQMAAPVDTVDLAIVVEGAAVDLVQVQAKETEAERDKRLGEALAGLSVLAVEIRQAFKELADALRACAPLMKESVEVPALAAVAPAVPAGVEGKTGTQEPPIPVQAVGQPRDQKAIVGDILARLTIPVKK